MGKCGIPCTEDITPEYYDEDGTLHVAVHCYKPCWRDDEHIGMKQPHSCDGGHLWTLPR